MYTKPATTFNPELTKLYEQNIFSVSEEVWASDTERVDVVIFLNGLAIMAFELKSNAAGQSYQDAIYQYRTERDPKTRLFRWKSGVLVCFAMDLEEVYMTTKLDKESTFSSRLTRERVKVSIRELETQFLRMITVCIICGIISCKRTVFWKSSVNLCSLK